MTDLTGRSFLSYRRLRSREAALLIAAQHDHGIPTWQDIRDLGSVPTEDEVRRTLADPSTASAVLYITPEVETSAFIRNVEIPKIIQRAEAGDGFFVVPIAAGGLDYATAASIGSNNLSARNLADWNMHKAAGPVLSPEEAAQVAERVLTHRIQGVHRHLPAGGSLRVGLFVRSAPAIERGVALTLDWSSRFTGKEADLKVWEEILLPSLSRITNVIRRHAPGRDVEAFGLPTLPAALALGCAFLNTCGIKLSWRQITLGRPDQLWSLSEERESTGFTPKISSKDPSARDIAALVSVADDAEPLFAACQRDLPSLRALVHVRRDGIYPHQIASPGEAVDIAMTVQESLRIVRREYGNIGTIHLFMAAPAGLAVLVGQLLNTFGIVQTYEHVVVDGSGRYKPAALLHPCA
jgi:hypothetical protein